jgi:uncharacterized protein (DUF2164 family)
MIKNIPKENKEQMMLKIKEYFYNERSEEIGDLGAQILLDYMIKEIGPHIYNQGIKDARSLIEQKMVSIEEDLYALERPIHLFKRE